MVRQKVVSHFLSKNWSNCTYNFTFYVLHFTINAPTVGLVQTLSLKGGSWHCDIFRYRQPRSENTEKKSFAKKASSSQKLKLP